jgi:hypothetical protein
MTKRTRYFVYGSFGLLVAGLCTGLFAYYGGLPAGAFSGRGGPAELAYVPEGAAVVAFADVQEVMASELRRKLQDAMPPGEAKGREELERETGIDLERDIDHVVACAMTGPAGGTGEVKSGFVAFRGRFDAARLEALAVEKGATVTDYKGRRLIGMPVDDHHRKAAGEASDTEAAAPRHAEARQMVLAFVEPGLAMFGDDASVRLAIDTAASGRDVRDNADLMRLVNDLDGDSNAWAVGRFDVFASRAKLPEGLSAQIPAIKWFAAAGKVNGGMNASLRAETRDEEAAKNLRDVVNGFMALARMQADSRPEWSALMSSVQLTGTGTTVQLSFSVPAEIMDVIVAQGHRGSHAD